MRLFHSKPEVTEIFCGDPYGGGDVELITIEYKFDVGLTGIVDVIDDDGDHVLHVYWDDSDSIPNSHEGKLVDVSGYLFEEEMAGGTVHLRKGVAISVDLTGYVGEGGLLVAWIVLLWLHLNIIIHQSLTDIYKKGRKIKEYIR